MKDIEYLKSLYTENYSITLSSGVFRSLFTTYPSAVIWIDENDNINITTRKDYNTYNYYLKKTTKYYETTDFDEIIVIYKLTAFKYIYGEEEILTNIISFLESRNNKVLTKVDNKK